MKPLYQFTNYDKAKILHELFPVEIPSLLDNIVEFCADFRRNEQEYRKSWPENAFTSFEVWQSYARETENVIREKRKSLVRSSSIFAREFCDMYIVFFCIDRIIKYAEHHSKNARFKITVDLLFKAEAW